jgi:hypothetical protein
MDTPKYRKFSKLNQHFCYILVKLSVLKGEARHNLLLIWTFLLFSRQALPRLPSMIIFIQADFWGRWQHVASPHVYVTMG